MGTRPQGALGGRKELGIVAAIVIVGLAAIGLGWRFKHQLANQPSEYSSPAELLQQGNEARGPGRVVTYIKNDQARVVAPAVARVTPQDWVEVSEGTVVSITGLESDPASEWIQCRSYGKKEPNAFTIHASFLRPYAPLMLDNTVELADVRLIEVGKPKAERIEVGGSLRNITKESLSQWVILCIFRDELNREIDMQRATIEKLQPNEIVDFQSAATTNRFASITLQIAHATHDGLRHYLSAVEINHGRE